MHRRDLVKARQRAFEEANRKWALPISGAAEGVETMRATYTIDSDLAADIATHLEHIASGGMPTAEMAATLLARFKKSATRRGFMPTTEEEHPELYRDAPPPGAPAPTG